MIKKSELRIGNWFNTLFNDKFKLEELRRDFVMGISENGFCNTSYNDLQPILISPEILEKAGFELFPWGYVKKAREDFGIRLNIKTFSYDVSGNTPVKLKYVHQLQNLFFALSGEELTIQL